MDKIEKKIFKFEIENAESSSETESITTINDSQLAH